MNAAALLPGWIRSRALALPEGDAAARAMAYIQNYPGITCEEVNDA